MPLRSGSVTFARLLAELPASGPKETARWVAKSLRTHAFRPLDSRAEEETLDAEFLDVRGGRGWKTASGMKRWMRGER